MMTTFWSLYIIVLSLACVGLSIFLLIWTRKLNIRSPLTGRRAMNMTVSANSDNPMPRWWYLMFWMTIAFAFFYMAAYPPWGTTRGS